MWCCLRGSRTAACLPHSYKHLQAAASSCDLVCCSAGDPFYEVLPLAGSPSASC